MPELKRRRRAASEPDADSTDATQEYSPYVPTFQSARPEDPNAQPTFTNESTWQPDYADDDADIPAPTAVILVLITMLVSLLNWLHSDILQSISLFQTMI